MSCSTTAMPAGSCARIVAACASCVSRGASTTGRTSACRTLPPSSWSRRCVYSSLRSRTRARAVSRLDPFADPVVPADPMATLPDLDWQAEIPVDSGKFAGYTLLASAFTETEVEAVADLLLGSGMAGFPTEKRTLVVYLRGAVPAFPDGTYLVGRLRAPMERLSTGRKGEEGDDDAFAKDGEVKKNNDVATSSWSEEKASTHGPIVATVGVSFSEKSRRKFSSLAPPSDAAYMSDLTVFEGERGEGLGAAMLTAAEQFAKEMRSQHLYLHVATKKPGVVRLYKNAGYGIRAVDPGIFGWRGRLLMSKRMTE